MLGLTLLSLFASSVRRRHSAVRLLRRCHTPGIEGLPRVKALVIEFDEDIREYVLLVQPFAPLPRFYIQEADLVFHDLSVLLDFVDDF